MARPEPWGLEYWQWKGKRSLVYVMCELLGRKAGVGGQCDVHQWGPLLFQSGTSDVFPGGEEDFQMFPEDFSAIIWAPVNVFGWRGKGRGIWRRGPCTIPGLQEKWEAGVAWGQIMEMLCYVHLLCYAHLFPGHYVYGSPDINMLWEIHHLIPGLTIYLLFLLLMSMTNPLCNLENIFSWSMVKEVNNWLECLTQRWRKIKCSESTERMANPCREIFSISVYFGHRIAHGKFR